METEIELKTQQPFENAVQRESTISPSEEKLPGARISPSKLEVLSSIFTQYNEAEDKDSFFSEILEEKPINKEDILKNAKWAIYGTQLHYLQYFSNIFATTAKLKRFPNELDFKTIFPNKKDKYYEALIKILDQTLKESIEEDPVLNAIEFWKIWRLNGHDFSPKRHKNYVIDPNDIKELWENQDFPSEEDLDTFVRNYKEKRLSEGPKSILLMSESFSLLNIYFSECNCQVPMFIDEIQVPKDFPNEPIKIIDYKTGKQFKKPTYKEKLQIFLMMTSVCVALVDEVNNKGIDFGLSQWDATHDINCISLPKFKRRSMYTNKGLINSVSPKEILTMNKIIGKNLTFLYINPLTQEELVINPNDVFLGNEKEMDNTLTYINDLTKFYIEFRDILKHKLSSQWAPYTLPSFPSEDFLKGRKPRLEDGRQLAINI